MSTKAKSGRDAFTFSLQGMKTIAPFATPPVIADDRIGRAWDQRFSHAPAAGVSTILMLEDLLGRYFAAGCCDRA